MNQLLYQFTIFRNSETEIQKYLKRNIQKSNKENFSSTIVKCRMASITKISI